MQTFMPHDSYRESARALDYRRLGKQRVECKQILNVLTGQSAGWANHPAVKMWRGHTSQLVLYAIDVCTEWRSRGYRDSLLPWFTDQLEVLPVAEAPSWMGYTEFHRSHRSNLTRKDVNFYGPKWPDVPADLPYIWPNSR